MFELLSNFNCFTVFSQEDWLLLPDFGSSQMSSYLSFLCFFSFPSSVLSALKISDTFVTCTFLLLLFTRGSLSSS